MKSLAEQLKPVQVIVTKNTRRTAAKRQLTALPTTELKRMLDDDTPAVAKFRTLVWNELLRRRQARAVACRR